MSILDLHAEELAGVAVNTPRIAPPAPSPRFSAWSAPARGVAVGAAQTGGFWADVLGAFGQVSAATDARPGGMFSAAAPDSEDARQKVLQGLDFSSPAGDRLRASLNDWKPDPQTANTAEQLLFELPRFVTKAVGYSLLSGPWVGAALTGADEALTASDELRLKGVDLETRTKVGAVQGVTAAAGVALPVAGKSLAQTAALVALGGPASFMGQQAATRAILDAADYDGLADQYDPLDPVGLAVSTLVPAGFGAWALRRAARQQRQREAERPPGEAPPATPEASTTPGQDDPQIPRETVDAARVQLAMDEQRRASLASPDDDAGAAADTAALDKANEQLARGEPVNVADVAPFDDVVVIGKRLEQQIARDFDAAVREYSQRPDSKGGKVLNTDTARELSADYLADRTLSAAVHEPASQFVKDLYARKLAEAPKEGEEPVVLFTAGGTGAGKSTAIENVPGVANVAETAQIIYDTNMNGYASSKQKIEQALAAGKDVVIAMVVRDPEDALVNGALPRAERQAAEFGTGRTVPLAEHIKTHLGALETVKRLGVEYAGHPRVTVRVIDNTLGRGNATERDLAWLEQQAYNDVEQRVRAALEKEREQGRISEATYRGFSGSAAAEDAGAAGPNRRVQAQDRAGADAEPAPPHQAAEVARGRPDTVITERGDEIAVHWSVIEADELITSHDNALARNPAYPAELQPRDRSRAASEQQIASIENRIRPELLGDSPKAADGAPIVGADGVVESGNARTIALRRAYESGKAEGYRAWLMANAGRFGIDSGAIGSARRPVLARVTEGTYNRAEFARAANESTVARMSASETARADAARMPDLEQMRAAEDGTINIASSGEFIRAFVQSMPASERAEMMTAAGELSQDGVRRIRNAVFSKAYGDADLVAMLAESTDANVKNILAGMLRAAPKVAKLRDLQAAGAAADADIAAPLVAAVRRFSQLRSDGMTVEQFAAQRGMFGDAEPPEVVAIMQGLQANARAPKRVGEMIDDMAETVKSLGDPRQSGMFGDAPKGEEAQALAANVARVAAAQAQFPDLMVQADGMDAPMRSRDYLAMVKQQAEEEAADAPLLQIAAECALLNGA